MSSFLHYLDRNSERILRLSLEHVIVTLVALAIGTVIGVTLGLLAYRRPRIRDVVLGAEGLLLTVPSFAMYSILLGIFHRLGSQLVITALVLYSLLPITRNTVTGLLGVDPAIVESAKGVGMGRLRVLLRIELPLAWPVVLTGVRVSAVLLVGIAALGTIVGGPGLGELLFAGLRTIGNPNAVNLAVTGTLGVVIIGLLFDFAFLAFARLTTSKGIR